MSENNDEQMMSDQELEVEDTVQDADSEVQFGKDAGNGPESSISDITDEQILSNPRLESLVEKIVNKRVTEELAKVEGSANSKKRAVTPKNKISNDRANFKSPSDTTLYAPALAKTQTPERLMNMVQHRAVNNSNVSTPGNPGLTGNAATNPIPDNQDFMNKISNFVESVRIDNERRERPGPANGKAGTAEGKNNDKVQTDSSTKDKIKQAKDRADQIILEAEQYKAMVDQPTGNTENIQSLNVNQGPGISDDEFFHLTCHIDMNIRSKIEKGGFVELEKLLPRDRNDRTEGKLELVNRDGQTYFAPSQRDSRITNIRRWEQAFRIYAAIYSTANPHRSGEIWQYVYVINSAATTYVWEEVAYYDFTFRQLMAANPGRSWAKTYVQMWQMALRTHIRTSNNSSNRGGQGEGQRKPRYCWKFNKGVACVESSCNFPHKCYYCHGTSHGIQSCREEG